MGKAFDRIKDGLDDIERWKAGRTKATIHFGGKSYEMTRPEHDAFRLGVAAGRLAGLREAAGVVEDWQCQHAAAIEDKGGPRRHLVAVRDAMDIKAAILALAKP